MKKMILTTTFLCLSLVTAQAGTTAKEAAFAAALKSAQQGDKEQAAMDAAAAAAKAEQERQAAEAALSSLTTELLNQADSLIGTTYKTEAVDQMQSSVRTFQLSPNEESIFTVMRYKLRLTSFKDGTSCQSVIYHPSKFHSWQIASVCALATNRTAIFHLNTSAKGVTQLSTDKQQGNYNVWTNLTRIDQSQDSADDQKYTKNAVQDCLLAQQTSSYNLSVTLTAQLSGYSFRSYVQETKTSLENLHQAIQTGKSLSVWEKLYPKCLKSSPDKEYQVRSSSAVSK